MPAEQVMLGTISTGAVDDIQRATQLARRMVTEFGMSEKLGSVRYAGQHLQYLGTAVAEGSDSSAATHETIGLVVPVATGITPFLTRAAAVCLATLMGGAVATHVMRREPAAVATILAVLTIVVAMVR